MIQITHELFENSGSFFAIEDAEKIGELTYFFTDEEPKVLIANHTWIHPSRRGCGIGDLLVENLVEYAQKNTLKISPICSFVVHYFEKQAHLSNLLATR